MMMPKPRLRESREPKAENPARASLRCPKECLVAWLNGEGGLGIQMLRMCNAKNPRVIVSLKAVKISIKRLRGRVLKVESTLKPKRSEAETETENVVGNKSQTVPRVIARLKSWIYLDNCRIIPGGAHCVFIIFQISAGFITRERLAASLPTPSSSKDTQPVNHC
ncbi:dcb4fdc2-1ca0-4386-9dcf-00140759de73 [Sclerotinia trifoliorum]|uniref:Dcb4fdc2-1ca0-4386-9dcf-00140759de73 n=1 Tax=Sclerotinia trifoliorum TaxID=28548 RepID=A0A8H2VWT3_9HELO|nr:dcb4fdc2-1ca0-4386-9dcf-00140759de73 [Sclerotinia trifoliorum]